MAGADAVRHSSAAPGVKSAAPSAGPVATPSSAPTTPLTTRVATTTSQAAPVIPPTDLSGDVYGFIRGVDITGSAIILDKVDWFEGAAAQQACIEDGVTTTDDNQCTGYYFRNVNPALRTVAVSPQATISTLEDGTHAAPSDLNAVANRIVKAGGSNIFHLVVTDGLVTSINEIYHP